MHDVRFHGPALSGSQNGSRPISILITEGEHLVALPIVTALNLVKGFSVHLASKSADVRTRYSRHLTSFHLAPEGINDEDYLEWMLKLADKVQADVVLPTHEKGTRYCIQNRAALEKRAKLPPLASLELFENVFDKGRLSRVLEELGLPHPATLRCDEHKDLAGRTGSFSFPALLKPKASDGSHGIRILASREEFLKILSTEPDYVMSCILQTYVPGRDLGCAVLCQDGKVLAYTVQQGLVIKEGSLAQHKQLEFLQDESVVKIVSRLMERIRWNGIAQLDLRRDSRTGEVVIIEVNPRFWGSLLASASAGVNFPVLACKAALGERIETPSYPHHLFADIRFATSLKAKSIVDRRPGLHRLPVRTNLRFVLGDPAPFVLGWMRKRHILPEKDPWLAQPDPALSTGTRGGLSFRTMLKIFMVMIRHRFKKY